VGKGAGALAQQGQIVQRVEDILLAGVAARMAGDDLLLVADDNGEGVRIEGEGRALLIDRHRIAVGLEFHLAVAVEPHQARDGIVECAFWQGPQQGLLLLPGGADVHRLALHDADIVPFAAGEQMGIQIGKGGHLWQWHEILAAGEADAVLDAALLLWLIGGAEVGRKQVVAAKNDECRLLLARVAAQDRLHRRGEIVIADALGHATKEAEGRFVTREETLLALGGKGHHKGAARVTQGHHKDLHGDALARQIDLRLAPIDLGVLAGVKLQGQERGRALLLLAQFATYTRTVTGLPVKPSAWMIWKMRWAV
jgi:hypothetical protein